MSAPDALQVVELAPAAPQVVQVAVPLGPTPIYVPGTAMNASGIVQWFAGDGPPPPFIPGARPGAMYVDELGGGLYQL